MKHIVKNYNLFLNENYNNFNVGDRVIVNGNQSDLIIKNKKGRIGKITNNSISIEFDIKFDNRLHNDSNKWTNNQCWNISKNNKYCSIEKYSDNIYLDKIVFSLLPIITVDEILKSKMVYIKHTDKSDMISYLSLNKSEQIKDNTYWTSNQRQEMKIGKFLNKVFPDKSKSDIENYVNDYKSSYKQYFKIFEFKMVEGEDIKKYYNEKNYDNAGGRLHSSCMRKENSQHRFDIYVENPDVCKMLILVSPSNSNKITGRALVWKLANGGTYMDRIYCANDDEMQLFINYAVEQGWRTYDSDGFTNEDYVRLTSDKDYGPKINNPYMDTFTQYIIPNELHSRSYSGRYDFTYNDY